MITSDDDGDRVLMSDGLKEVMPIQEAEDKFLLFEIDCRFWSEGTDGAVIDSQFVTPGNLVACKHEETTNRKHVSFRVELADGMHVLSQYSKRPMTLRFGFRMCFKPSTKFAASCNPFLDCYKAVKELSVSDIDYDHMMCLLNIDM